MSRQEKKGKKAPKVLEMRSISYRLIVLIVIALMKVLSIVREQIDSSQCVSTGEKFLGRFSEMSLARQDPEARNLLPGQQNTPIWNTSTTTGGPRGEFLSCKSGYALFLTPWDALRMLRQNSKDPEKKQIQDLPRTLS